MTEYILIVSITLPFTIAFYYLKDRIDKNKEQFEDNKKEIDFEIKYIKNYMKTMDKELIHQSGLIVSLLDHLDLETKYIRPKDSHYEIIKKKGKK